MITNVLPPFYGSRCIYPLVHYAEEAQTPKCAVFAAKQTKMNFFPQCSYITCYTDNAFKGGSGIGHKMSE